MYCREDVEIAIVLVVVFLARIMCRGTNSAIFITPPRLVGAPWKENHHIKLLPMKCLSDDITFEFDV